MKKRLILPVILCAMPAIAAPAPYEHYQAMQPETLEQALAQMKEVTEQTAFAIKAGDMRKVHELSYSLEAAVEFIGEELEDIAEQVEQMHEASEKRQKKKVTEAFETFEPKVQLLSK